MNRKAFTLLEIMLVVFILAILMAATVPRFSMTYRHMVLKETGENTLALIKYARDQSILNGKKGFIKVDKDKGRIFISNDKGEEDTSITSSKNEIRMGRNTSLTSDVDLICFSPSGDGTPFEVKISSDEMTIVCRTIESKEKFELIEKEE
jgi:prepilin-type N-terminal cleavage/methylation domain-containing protein